MVSERTLDIDRERTLDMVSERTLDIDRERTLDIVRERTLDIDTVRRDSSIQQQTQPGFSQKCTTQPTGAMMSCDNTRIDQYESSA